VGKCGFDYLFVLARDELVGGEKRAAHVFTVPYTVRYQNDYTPSIYFYTVTYTRYEKLKKPNM
jgi:hypothetical protein